MCSLHEMCWWRIEDKERAHFAAQPQTACGALFLGSAPGNHYIQSLFLRGPRQNQSSTEIAPIEIQSCYIRDHNFSRHVRRKGRHRSFHHLRRGGLVLGRAGRLQGRIQ